MIIIFTIQYDYSTNCVVDYLNYLGEKVVRINGDDDVYKFESINKYGIYFRNTITGEIINLKEAKACWWRRTGISYRHFIDTGINKNLLIDGIDITLFTKDRNQYFIDEFSALKNYVFNSVYEHCKINLGKPLFNLNRLIVMDIAEKHGLKTPDYEVIHNGKQLLKAKTELGGAVTKAISNGIYDDIDNHRFYTYTELLEEDFYRDNQKNVFFPSLITGLVKKKIEIRTFYIEGHFFSMAVYSQSNEKTKVDFRKYANNRFEPYKLPDEIEEKLKKIFEDLKLNCGSVDLIVDKDGEYIFLEINPVGQYSMTSDPCNYNLDKIITNYLVDGRVEIN